MAANVDVDAADDTNDWEEEESYVLVEMSGITHEEFKNSGHYQLIGIDSSSPYLKLGKCVFKGQYKQAFGTCIFFEEGNEKIDNVPKMNYSCKTVKKLEMERVFLKPKKQTLGSQKPSTTDKLDEETSTDMDTS